MAEPKTSDERPSEDSVLDLDAGEAEVPRGSDALRSSITQEPYNPDKANDDARRLIAISLIVLLAAVILLTFWALLWALAAGKADTKTNYEHIAGILNILFGPIVTLVGSATGFYFGAQNRQSTPPPKPPPGKL